MPELPDLLYIRDYLQSHVSGHGIQGVTIKEPIVLRIGVEGGAVQVLSGRTIGDITLRGPFIRFALSEDTDLILNLMLAGRLHHQHNGKSPGHMCFSLALDDGSTLHFCDDQKMGKAYIVRAGEYDIIPRYNTQGIDILSDAFTPELFRGLVSRHTRKQVRVFINDHTILSAIGNAYADEILYAARIHPKTFVARLGSGEVDQLYAAIRDVMAWGTGEVARAARPIDEKVRDHMRVRGRKGEPCERCGTTIRREGVRGYDVFFCPNCQPASRTLFIDWKKQT